MSFQERYSPQPLAANASYLAPQGVNGTGGFLCITSGTLSISRPTISGVVVVVNAMPVTAGIYTPVPFQFGPNFTVTLAGGASGVLGLQS